MRGYTWLWVLVGAGVVYWLWKRHQAATAPTTTSATAAPATDIFSTAHPTNAQLEAAGFPLG